MKTNALSNSGFNVVVILLSALAVLLIYAVLAGKRVPVLSTDRLALLGLIVIGMAICSLGGISRVSANNAWLHPLSILGYLLGAVIILIGIAALFGKLIPPLTSYYQSFIVVTAIAVVKLVLTTIHHLFL